MSAADGPTLAPDAGSGVAPFPMTAEDFETDERVSFSRLTNKWTLETEDGAEYEYDEALRRWIPVLDEEMLARQQEAYKVSGVDDEATNPSQERKNKKRKNYTGAGEDDDEAGRKSKQKKQRQDPPPKKNSSIYITNLPRDATAEEVREVFSRCGVISEEIDTGKPRIKLYTNPDGTLKGDALVTYFRPESVSLAIQMLDDTDFRFGVPASEGKMRVSEADFSYKKNKDQNGGNKGEEQKKNSNAWEKKKIIKRTQKLNSKLADWDDDDPSIISKEEANKRRFEKIVILKHMFTLQELEEDPAVLLDLKEDIREECEKLGDVTMVTLYDKEPDGVVSVKFKTAEQALACVRVMNGRFFAGQTVEAYIYDGSERFKKTGTKKAGEEDDEDEQQRLDRFGEWLEKEGDEVAHV